MGHSDTHRKLHELFNSRRLDEVEQFLAPGFMFEDLARGITVKTASEFVGYLQGWVDAFSDGQVGSPTYLEGPDHSVATFHGRGHQDGRLGPFDPTGRMLDLPFCEVVHYASDGKVLASESYYDQMQMLTQLGHLSGPAEQAGSTDSLETAVREMFTVFDRMDLDAARALFTEDAQGVDEITRGWLRGADKLDDYFAQLQESVSAVRSELRDVHETVYGDTGVLTCMLEQDYTYEGQQLHVTAPTTVCLRRHGDSWKVSLVHSVPLSAEAGV